MIPFRLYVVVDTTIGGRHTLAKLGTIADEGRARVGFYLRDEPDTGYEHGSVEARVTKSGASAFVRARPHQDWLLFRPGVHLKANEIPLARAVRRQLETEHVNSPIAASVHSLDEARAARDAGCDFLVFGHVFETPSKQATPARGLDALRDLCREVAPLPVFAIGGMTPERVADCRAAGAHGVAVIRALLEPEDPRPALRAFLEALYG